MQIVCPAATSCLRCFREPGKTIFFSPFLLFFLSLAQKFPPPSSKRQPFPQREEATADVLPEVLRHSLPSAVFTPPADSSLSTSSKWVLPISPHSSPSASAEANNPLRVFVSLSHVTFGPKRWELPSTEYSILHSTANDLRRDRHPLVNSEKLKAAAEGLSQIGKAFAIATTVVFGGATLAFILTASKLELHNDYIDSMEGATLSGRQAAAYVCNAGDELAALHKTLVTNGCKEIEEDATKAEELSIV